MDYTSYEPSGKMREELFSQQNGKCAICENQIDKETAHIDHCHKTNKVRGLLCPNCNFGLGHFKDNPEVLLSAFKYLIIRNTAAEIEVSIDRVKTEAEQETSQALSQALSQLEEYQLPRFNEPIQYLREQKLSERKMAKALGITRHQVRKALDA